MLTVVCPSCQANLRVRPELAGRAGKCPKCGAIVQVPALDAEAAEDRAESGLSPRETTAGDEFPDIEPTDRLVRDYHYLVVDRNGLVAAWENNGQGWTIRSGTTFVRAARNADKLPSQGDFKLVELQLARTEDGSHRLTGLAVYQLAPRYALSRIERGEDAILQAVRGPAPLSKEQKTAVFAYIREKFMRPIWEDHAALVDYLTNLDYHSPGISPHTHPFVT
ncbi:MAG: hypothetical protein GYA33_07975 [Thermogutta sp.]|nr:hypothetical protein [Thermogutta sp.]